MNRGWYGFPTRAPIGIGADATVKLLDLNMAMMIPTSAANRRFEMMLPPGVVELMVYCLDMRWTTGPHTVTMALANKAGTAAPTLPITIDGATVVTAFSTRAIFTVGGRSNVSESRSAFGASNLTHMVGSNLATTVPPVDRFWFYTSAADRILSGSLVIYGLFR